MIISEDYVDLETPSGLMRTFIYKPVAAAQYPAVMLFSEIYHVTGPIARVARRLASKGYLVAAPEVYHEFEPLGTVLNYDKEGTDKGNRYKIEKSVAAFDADTAVLISHLQARSDCTGSLGSMGICLGGHLSYRAAMLDAIAASVCFNPTDIHSHGLGLGKQDNTFDRTPEINAEMLLVWGRQDPHIPLEGRRRIYEMLVTHEIVFSWHEFNAQHAFTRDEGHRYDSALTDISFALAFELFNRRLQLCEPHGLTENPGPNLKTC